MLVPVHRNYIIIFRAGAASRTLSVYLLQPKYAREVIEGFMLQLIICTFSAQHLKYFLSYRA